MSSISYFHMAISLTSYLLYISHNMWHLQLLKKIGSTKLCEKKEKEKEMMFNGVTSTKEWYISSYKMLHQQFIYHVVSKKKN